MAVQNQLINQNTAVAPSTGKEIASFFAGANVKKYLAKAIGGEESTFISEIVSAVNTTPALSECECVSIMSAGLLAHSFKLPIAPGLGFAWMVPYNNTKRNCKEAQFQIGWKGYVQLAIRTGQYKRIVVLPIKEGELEYFDPLTEEIKLNLIDDEDVRDAAPTIGYYAAFQLINGFTKAIYWSKKKMVNHADRYSQAFSKNATKGKYPKVSYADYVEGKYPEKDAWLYSSYWYKEFDSMALKTMIRRLIGQWGIMSIELQTAYAKDMAVIKEDGTAEYVDSDIVITDAEPVVEEETEPSPAVRPTVDEHATARTSAPQKKNAAAAALFGGK